MRFEYVSEYEMVLSALIVSESVPGAAVCTAGDSSCLMHIGGGLSRIRSGTRTLHLAQILAATRTAPHVLTEAAR